MHWLFMGVSAFCGFMWARTIYLGRSDHGRDIRLMRRVGRIVGGLGYWLEESPPAGRVFADVEGVDRDLVVAFNRARREAWLAAADEDLGDDLEAFEREAA